MLAWLVDEHAIEPHIPVFDKSARDDGTFSRGDFAYDQERDLPGCHRPEPPKARKADPAACSEARLSTGEPARLSPRSIQNG